MPTVLSFNGPENLLEGATSLPMGYPSLYQPLSYWKEAEYGRS